MQVQQQSVTADLCAAREFTALSASRPQLVLVFGSVAALQSAAAALQKAFAGACLAGCSTSGEITGDGVSDGTLVVTALTFDSARVDQASTRLSGMEDSYAAGQRLASGLERSGLRAIVLFGQGVKINGSAVLAGMKDVVGAGIPITGGLAGDAGAFVQTWVLNNQGLSSDGLVCIGFYGDSLEISHGSFGGWSPFGPARKVTRCEHNILYEIDGESALSVYKRYLGEHAESLPSSGLLFPFAMLGKDHNELGLIRTILGVDEQTGSLTLAGDVDPNGYLRLMHASTDALVEGAKVAAHAARGLRGPEDAGFALLVSCVGRKLVMGGRVDEEVEAVASVFGSQARLAGFYSYGEISPLSGASESKLHNQTMTITYFTEST